ncbi:MAG: excinuclease ABC subunit A [Verrucomicrobia bacterium]|nr:excinuclease ABC subunit A [Verrucomicrobiota bacterium]
MTTNRSPSPEAIIVHGAREHNLKDIDASIPLNRFTVITGVSGSGKSTLAFDILFTEGQRRFLDSLNAYARQFIAPLKKADFDLITGLPPTVSIEQRTSRGGGKSTVATVTEIHPFLRLLFTRLGTVYCPDCDVAVRPQTKAELCKRLAAESRRRGELTLLAPVVRNRKGFHSELCEWAYHKGYSHLRVDGRLTQTDKPLRLERFKEHNIEIVTGTITKRHSASALNRELARLVDVTIDLGHGTVYAMDNRNNITVHSIKSICPACGNSFEITDPKMLSYNSPRGWCPECRGFAEIFYLPNVDRGARADAIEESWFKWQEGEREVCPKCGGARLNPLARSVRIENIGAKALRKLDLTTTATGPALHEIEKLDTVQALDFFKSIKFSKSSGRIARDIIPEIIERLKFLDAVGLGYLQLNRGITTLSGGEAQRIRLAAQLGSNLCGVLYILDEPTIGLHPRDNERLLDILAALRSKGNSLVLVEHDEATMNHADHIVDLGPGAGENGGNLVAQGTLEELMQNAESVTGRWLLNKRKHTEQRQRRHVPSGRNNTPLISNEFPAIKLTGAWLHNLKQPVAVFPVGRLIAVTGVSGSGKSTLVRECLITALKRGYTSAAAARESTTAPLHGTAESNIKIHSIHEVDQSPIGRTLRSVPATYTGFFDEIRRLFAMTPEAKLRGYGPGRFSFNSKQGACPECKGSGFIKMEIPLLPAASIVCETCNGTRFNNETLDITFHDKNIAQILDLSVDEAVRFFDGFPRIKRALNALRDTGLGYIKIGQTSPSLSGGEAQRLKLVSHLTTSLRRHHNTRFDKADTKLFVLEEPTTGLHMADVHNLVKVLHRLVDAGHTVIVIEHNLDFIAETDWVIDIGPESGDKGGRIIAQGTPETIAENKYSHTGEFLNKILNPK